MTSRILPLGTSAPAPPTLGEMPVLSNSHLGDRYWRLRIHAPAVARDARAGQFLMLTPSISPALGLPRPMAVYDADIAAGTVDVVYGVVGPGTGLLAALRPGATVTTLGPLGRSFELPDTARRLLVIGRGIGICSLALLARPASRPGVGEVTAVLSVRRTDVVIGAELFRSCGARVVEVSDELGSSAPEAVRDRLMALLDGTPPDLVAVCGSRRLTRLAAWLAGRWRSDAQVCVEAHMACGLGYCHCCTTADAIAPTTDEAVEQPLVCTSGPVFRLAPDRVGATQPRGSQAADVPGW